MPPPVLHLGSVREARRPGVAREAVALVGWWAAGAVAAAGGAAVGLGIGRLWMGPVVFDLLPGAPLTQTASVAALLAGAAGLLVGVLAGTARAGEDRGGAAIEWGVYGAGIGAAFGVLTPPLAFNLGAALPPAESHVLAFAIVGLLGGVVGRAASGSGSLAVAAGWGVAGAVAGGGGWWAALAVGGLLPGPDALPAVLEYRLTDAALFLAAVGGGCGLVLGAAMGLLRGAALAWGVGVGLVGMAGGGACLPLVAATRGVLSPEASSTLAWALTGLLAGVVSYGLSRRPVASEQVDEDEWLDGGSPPESGQPRGVRAAGRGVAAGPVSRVLPVVAVSGGCLVAVVVAPPSELGWALLAVGLLGLAVAWALVGQERRIRELEERIRGR